MSANSPRKGLRHPVPAPAVAGEAPGEVQCREGEAVAAQGSITDRLLVIISGWALRSRRSPDGRSQITGLYLPGDLCDPLWLRSAPSQSVIAAGPLRARSVSGQTLRTEMERRPSLARAIWNEVAAANAAAAEWALVLGLKSAVERVAHLLCETYTRLQRRGRAAGGQCEFQLTHAEIADLTGLSSTHVERTLRDLQGVKLIGPLKRRLRILDFERLARTAAFDPSYLGQSIDWRTIFEPANEGVSGQG